MSQTIRNVTHPSELSRSTLKKSLVCSFPILRSRATLRATSSSSTTRWGRTSLATTTWPSTPSPGGQPGSSLLNGPWWLRNGPCCSLSQEIVQTRVKLNYEVPEKREQEEVSYQWFFWKTQNVHQEVSFVFSSSQVFVTVAAAWAPDEI